MVIFASVLQICSVLQHFGKLVTPNVGHVGTKRHANEQIRAERTIINGRQFPFLLSWSIGWNIMHIKKRMVLCRSRQLQLLKAEIIKRLIGT